ncbi:aspartate racemase [Desulfitobacterium dehalogenans ATCC 51507]|uniref:Aspartate racemase n=1 Tax=Desulfitobacterium dehalogenans (strain ATCC 51507 / DSM 9161 / JW/IU-DC1) TaxID=756499 RepID=I4A4X8_DESDJ|nr:amino acid racemase [Desulfitobacterium dehalogenans]AFL99012.1 aspartate racemase [Desulfitobacterium dehalogenans ATCC 51507]
MNKVIGILGGMGPLATVDMFNKIVTLTEATRDQDHIHLIIDNYPGIPNRLDFLLGDGESPEKAMVESALKLQSMGADAIIMPCNTAHYFYDAIKKHLRIDFINMIEETAKEIKKESTRCKKIGLLATRGTYNTGVYDKTFASYDMEVIKPDEEGRQAIADLILAIKVGQDTFDLTSIYRVIAQLKKKNAEILVLGCTELPIAFEKFNINEKYIDPTKILACSAIRYAERKVRESSN